MIEFLKETLLCFATGVCVVGVTLTVLGLIYLLCMGVLMIRRRLPKGPWVKWTGWGLGVVVWLTFIGGMFRL